MVAVPLAVAVGETLPQGAVLHETVQFTPVFAAKFETVAVICVVCVASIFAEVGETETTIAGTVIVAEPDLVASAEEVAVSVKVRVLEGGVDGAV